MISQKNLICYSMALKVNIKPLSDPYLQKLATTTKLRLNTIWFYTSIFSFQISWYEAWTPS